MYVAFFTFETVYQTYVHKYLDILYALGQLTHSVILCKAQHLDKQLN